MQTRRQLEQGTHRARMARTASGLLHHSVVTLRLILPLPSVYTLTHRDSQHTTVTVPYFNRIIHPLLYKFSADIHKLDKLHDTFAVLL